MAGHKGKICCGTDPGVPSSPDKGLGAFHPVCVEN